MSYLVLFLLALIPVGMAFLAARVLYQLYLEITLWRVMRILQADTVEVEKRLENDPESLNRYLEERKSHQMEVLRWQLLRLFEKRLSSQNKEERTEAERIVGILRSERSKVGINSISKTVEFMSLSSLGVTDKELVDLLEEAGVRPADLTEVSDIFPKPIKSFPFSMKSRLRQMLLLQRAFSVTRILR